MQPEQAALAQYVGRSGAGKINPLFASNAEWASVDQPKSDMIGDYVNGGRIGRIRPL